MRYFVKDIFSFLFYKVRKRAKPRVKAGIVRKQPGKMANGRVQKSILQNLNYRTSETALSIYYLNSGRLQKSTAKRLATKPVETGNPPLVSLLLHNRKASILLLLLLIQQSNIHCFSVLFPFNFHLYIDIFTKHLYLV